MPEQEMSLMGHLQELRKRVMVCAAAMVFGVVLAFAFRSYIFDALYAAGDHPDLYFSKLTGGTSIVIKVSLYCGIVITLPVTLYEGIMFLAPALSKRQKRFLLLIVPGVLFSFAAGAAFAYFIVVPPVVDFLLNFGTDIGLTPLVDVESYVGTITALMLWLGLGFELPFIMYILSLVGITTPTAYSNFRRPWIIIAVILGAVITPTFDPINQSLVAGPFIVLYEVGILLSHVAWWGKKKEKPL